MFSLWEIHALLCALRMSLVHTWGRSDIICFISNVVCKSPATSLVITVVVVELEVSGSDLLT